MATRVTQTVLGTAYTTSPDARATAMGMEVLENAAAEARATALGLEVLENAAASARVTTMAFEVIRSVTGTAPTPAGSGAILCILGG